jgi:hypothetical protein
MHYVSKQVQADEFQGEWNKSGKQTPRWYIVCQYMSQGNVAEQFSQNVGRQVSGAPSQGISKTSEEMMDKSVYVSASSFNKGSVLLTAVALAVAIGLQ